MNPLTRRPVLTPRQSEMRLVTQWYEADRNQLNSYFGGAASGRGDRTGLSAAVSPAAVPLSTARIARLKRHDLDWQAALAVIDAARLSSAARADLDRLTSAVQRNLQQLDLDA